MTHPYDYKQKYHDAYYSYLTAIDQGDYADNWAKYMRENELDLCTDEEQKDEYEAWRKGYAEDLAFNELESGQ